MTNKERQKQLDEQKWYMSEAKGYDNSGEMDWCDHCLYQDGIYCSIPQETREQRCSCATAYNRMRRKMIPCKTVQNASNGKCAEE